MVRYEVRDVPDNLPPGTYAVKVNAATWVKGEAVIVLKFWGDVNPNDPTLFTITKADDGLNLKEQEAIRNDEQGVSGFEL